MLDRRHFLAASAGGLLAGTGAVPRAQAQAIKKPVHMIVGFPAGGGTDVTARVLAESLRSAGYASTILVENKAGASARIAVEYVKNAEPDGTVMLFTPDFPMTLYPHSFKSLSYDPLKDFTPVAPATQSMLSFVVGPAVPASVKTLSDFVAVVQSQPGQGELRHHLGRRHAAFRRRHAVERIEDADEPGALPRRRAGAAGCRRRPHSRERQSAERKHPARQRRLGAHPGGHWLEAFAVPAGRADHRRKPATMSWSKPGSACSCRPRCRADVLNALSAAMKEASQSAALKDNLAKFGSVPTFQTPAQFAETMKAELKRWGPVVKASGFVAVD